MLIVYIDSAGLPMLITFPLVQISGEVLDGAALAGRLERRCFGWSWTGKLLFNRGQKIIKHMFTMLFRP
jgi:hypothetical protein